MDPLTAAVAVLLGALAGLATGLVPGLHVNTMVPLAAGVAASSGPAVALGLVAVATVHGFVGMLPAVYLGAPGEDTAVAAWPAHRMLARGAGPQAVHTSVHAGLVALVACALLLLPYKWLLAEPVRLLPLLARATRWLVGGALLVLLAQEAARRRLAAALVVTALAGALGWLARDWPVAAVLPVPASPMLPLLSGLFGVPALLLALRDGGQVPLQDPLPRPLDRPAPRSLGPALQGVAASLVTAVLPGFTAAVATALARAGRPPSNDPRPVVATLSAVNAAHPLLALSVLWIAGRPRTGLAIAVQGLWPVAPWTRGPPAGLQWAVAAALVAGAVGAVGTLWLDRRVAARVHRVPARPLNGAALAVVLGIVALLSGPWGLVLLAAATAVGLLPPALRVRRVHLVAALLVPILVG